MKLRHHLMICILFAMVLPVMLHAQPRSTSGTILIVHSYAMDYQWTEALHDGIISALKKSSPSTCFRVEFMDSKNYFSKTYFASLASLYSSKFKDIQFDGILVTDNNALYFMESFGKKIFPEIPVVACGINNAVPPKQGTHVKSVIAEQAHHKATLSQALKFWPDLQTVFVIKDATPTGISIAKELEQELPSFNLPFNVEFISDRTLEELKLFVSTRKKTELLYLLPFFRDKKGSVFTQGQIGRELSMVASVPIITPWAFQVGTGVLGGCVVSAENMGELAVTTLLKILNRKTFEPFQTGASVHGSLYDYSVIRQFNINKRLLPADTVFINKPKTFYEQYSAVLIPAITITGILTIVSLLLFLNLKKQKIINRKNLHLIKMDQELIETQRELVNTLGEVIEARSKETGNHVKRVAKISRLIGEKIGMNKKDLDLLEMSSPMHDLGKIGIPEEILHKPGKLSEKEFEIIKTHTDIGKSILDVSDRDLLCKAATIAYQHHERWDGAGYPCGLKGEEISIFARITMLADVYDAVSSKRCYKDNWPEERVFKHIRFGRGLCFDPQLVDVFFDNIDEIIAIRARYPDSDTNIDWSQERTCLEKKA